MPNTQYKQYIILLDPNDLDESKLIKFLESKHTKKHKSSYSSILKTGLKRLMEDEKSNLEIKNEK